MSANILDSCTISPIILDHESFKVSSPFSYVLVVSSILNGSIIPFSISTTPFTPLSFASLIALFASLGLPNSIVDINESVDAFPESIDLISSRTLSIGIPIDPAILERTFANSTVFVDTSSTVLPNAPPIDIVCPIACWYISSS